MPEEKVSRYDRDEVKRLEREIELTGDNRFVGMPPAADAGPRQPCPHVNTMGHEWESHCVDCGEVWKHSPPDYSVTTPVPQEAAPPEVLTRKELITEIQELKAATAPDWAMRVAARIVLYFRGDDNLPETVRYVAALIREAGSERERVEPKSLWGWPIDEIKSAMRQWQSKHGSKLPTEFEHECREASRLLGGQ